MTDQQLQHATDGHQYRDLRVTRGIAIVMAVGLFLLTVLVQGVLAPLALDWWRSDPNADVKELRAAITQLANTVSTMVELQAQREEAANRRFDLIDKQVYANKSAIEKTNDRVDRILMRSDIDVTHQWPADALLAWALFRGANLLESSDDRTEPQAAKGAGKKRDMAGQLQALVYPDIYGYCGPEYLPVAARRHCRGA